MDRMVAVAEARACRLIGSTTQDLGTNNEHAYEKTVLRTMGMSGVSIGTWMTPSVMVCDDLLNSKIVRISRGTSPGNSALISLDTLKSFIPTDRGTRVREQIV